MNTEKPKYIYSIADHIYDGCSQAKFSHYKQAEEVTPTRNGRYVFIFVLQGQLDIYNKRGLELIREKAFAIIDKEQTVKCVCSPETTILEFAPPSRIERFCKSASTIFKMPCSEHVPFNDEIDRWIEQLWNEVQQNSKINPHSHCKDLCRIMRKYPDLVLGTLYVPIYACSKRCDVCQEISIK